MCTLTLNTPHRRTDYPTALWESCVLLLCLLKEYGGERVKKGKPEDIELWIRDAQISSPEFNVEIKSSTCHPPNPMIFSDLDILT